MYDIDPTVCKSYVNINSTGSHKREKPAYSANALCLVATNLCYYKFLILLEHGPP